MLRIGTAGWTIPKPHAAEFPTEGTHLQRYAQLLSAVEINSSFYRPHKPATYARWAASVPPEFRFAVKVPQEITHIRMLAGVIGPLERFLSEAAALGDKLGPLVVQLPPSLVFDDAIADPFFNALRARFDGFVVCEPRHASWFTDHVDQLLTDYRVARAAADPASPPPAAAPGAWTGLRYHRLHGSPRMYYSGYESEYLDTTANLLREDLSTERWCIFDNTALGEATHDAIALTGRLKSAGITARQRNDGGQ